MRPLVAVRRAVAFDPGFVGRDALFWPLARAAGTLGPHGDFPPVQELARVFEGDPPVRFVPSGPRRRRGAPVDVRSLYDARITIERAVPTRPGCWHDLMNALVWGTFPRAKLALHTRQHRLIAARIEADARALPPRSPELDALALLDEGGVVVLATDAAEVRASLRTGRAGQLRERVESGAVDAMVFGHAIYESLALGVKPAVVAALVLERACEAVDVARQADDALASALDDGENLSSPRELARVDVSEVRPGPRGSRSWHRMSHGSPRVAYSTRWSEPCDVFDET